MDFRSTISFFRKTNFSSFDFLSQYETDSIISILNRAVTEIRLTRNQKYPGAHDSDFGELKHPINVRFAPENYIQNGIFYRKTGEKYSDAVNRLKYDKFYADKQFFTSLLLDTITEVRCTGDFRRFTNVVKDEQALNQEEDDFIEDYVRNKFLETELKNKIQQLELAERDFILLPKTLDEYHIWNNVKVRYVRNWEKARQGQQKYFYHNQERKYENEICESEKRIVQETRCQVESEYFLMTNIEWMKSQSVEWMEKYDADYEQVEFELHRAHENIEEFEKYSQSMKDVYEKRQKKMDDWFKYKQDKAHATEIEILQNKMAVKIQAWWRGTMVRNGYGPWRKKTKGKKRKKATKKIYKENS